ncbi:hypothetical protein RND81_05G274400 [Saponaria officinalis]|uniref:Uncharacterized protein n=1 Tax=Saponaria officinalis TaxID=3572 RepID=A0AAW1KXU6_SAPOF
MESRFCMNSSCGAKTTVQWKKGWSVKSGDAADLCFNCGSAYESAVYCDTFHLEETGWRECSLCNKRLHCGCSASASFLEIQDFGGVWCTQCAHTAACHSVMRDGISCEGQELSKYINANDLQNSQINNPTDRICGQLKSEANSSSLGLVGWSLSNMSHVLNGPTVYAQPSEDENNEEVKDTQGPPLPKLNISLPSPEETSNSDPSFFSGSGIEGDKSRPAFCQTGQRPRHIFPKPPKSNTTKGFDANKNPFSPMRVARPPAEGRLRNQLLPRYWPKITDQELQKISGDLNSTIVPLFEKILSASDASRIGRLVLPKACAEAYFPPINQSEGLPLKIQDVKGNEWTFQFRFWPNNNSRMYVLEGVTPCIQSMQLQAGDTVTFSRIDPGGKLVIGYRKASNVLEIQDTQTSLANSSGPPSAESFYSDVTDALAASDVCLVLPSTRVGQDHLNFVPTQLEMAKGKTVLNKCETLSRENENPLQQPTLTPEKKRTRNISSKSKRLIMHNEDAFELRLSWEETQDLLRPPPSLEPNIVMVDNYEFEEYSEPPVFGKKTYFINRLSGVQDQWAQCDKCSKWRKLPADVLLPPKWKCSENVWDLSRSSCGTSEEKSSKDLESICRINKDLKKGKLAESPELGQGCEPSGLDALATAATLGDNAEASAGATTRHPRHRPGCSCIVCIQPPSGKGKHKSSCVCNVCLTVKRRFKTLMMRKKKRQGEREAELALKKSHDRPIKRPRLVKNASTDGGISENVCLENDIHGHLQSEEGESSSKGCIDLNFDPIRDDDARVIVKLSTDMISLAQAARDPLDMYMNPNELANLLHKQQTDDDSYLQQASGEGCLTSGNDKKEDDDQGPKKCTLD